LESKELGVSMLLLDSLSISYNI